MSGTFSMPFQLTGGAGYKANPTYDSTLRRNSAWYRNHSAASNAQEEDRRMSQMSDGNANAAAQAVSNVEASARRGSVQMAQGGAATANMRKGSVVVASDATRKDSIFGLEGTAGVQMDPNRRPSTSLASDLYHKIKDRKSSH